MAAEACSALGWCCTGDGEKLKEHWESERLRESWWGLLWCSALYTCSRWMTSSRELLGFITAPALLENSLMKHLTCATSSREYWTLMGQGFHKLTHITKKRKQSLYGAIELNSGHCERSRSKAIEDDKVTGVSWVSTTEMKTITFCIRHDLVKMLINMSCRKDKRRIN